MKTKTFTFNGTRYYIRGQTEDEIFNKMVAKRVELELEAMSVEGKPTLVDEWFKSYMQTYKKDVSEYTYKSYEGIYRNNIMPYIGQMSLPAVKPIMCQQILNNISSLSDSSIKKTFFLMRQMFMKAYENDLIKKMPIKGIEVPKGYSNERRALTDEERKAFIKSSENGRNSGLFCKIIYYCGLRPSEVKRIQGGDYQNGILHVRGKKTKSSIRDVPIPPVLIFPDIQIGELLFHTSSGRMIDKNRIRQYWLSVKRSMNLDSNNDLTMYCLRHDYCTRLEEAGVPINIASRLMGHSSVEITSKIYTHGNNVTLKQAQSLINQHLSVDKSSNYVKKTPQNDYFSTSQQEIKKAPKPFKFQDF